MIKTIEVVFDGRNFVPSEAVDLPAGTRLNLPLPDVSLWTPSRLVSNNPWPLTEHEKEEWEELRKQWENVPEEFRSVEEAVSYSRGRPWPKYQQMPDSDDTDYASETGREGNR